jgi:hypothetical protein
MTDLLILGILASRFKARATLEAENRVLRQQVNVLRREMPKRPHLNNTDRFLFGWLYRWFPSLRWLRSSGRRPSFAGTVLRWVSGVLALAIPQPCWQTEGVYTKNLTAGVMVMKSAQDGA